MAFGAGSSVYCAQQSVFELRCADIYGKKYCTTIYGMLYTAKGTAALLVPLSSYMSLRSGWIVVLVAAAASGSWVASRNSGNLAISAFVTT